MIGERAIIQIMSKHMENVRDLCGNDCYHRWPMKEFAAPRSGQTLEEAGFTVDPWLGSEVTVSTEERALLIYNCRCVYSHMYWVNLYTL